MGALSLLGCGVDSHSSQVRLLIFYGIDLSVCCVFVFIIIFVSSTFFKHRSLAVLICWMFSTSSKGIRTRTYGCQRLCFFLTLLLLGVFFWIEILFSLAVFIFIIRHSFSFIIICNERVDPPGRQYLHDGHITKK